MAYMNAEHAATIRTNLKKAFPNFKFSVTVKHYSAVTVAIMKSPLDFSEDFKNHSCGDSNYIQLNHYYLENYSNSDTLKKIYNIINDGNFDKSEPMIDYFCAGFYINFHIGQWNKPYIQTK